MAIYGRRDGTIPSSGDGINIDRNKPVRVTTDRRMDNLRIMCIADWYAVYIAADEDRNLWTFGENALNAIGEYTFPGNTAHTPDGLCSRMVCYSLDKKD